MAAILDLDVVFFFTVKMADKHDFWTKQDLVMEYKDTVSVFKDSDKISARTEEMIECGRDVFKVGEPCRFFILENALSGIIGIPIGIIWW